MTALPDHVPATIRCTLPRGWRVLDPASAAVPSHGWHGELAAVHDEGPAARRRAQRLARAGVALVAACAGAPDDAGRTDRTCRASLVLAVHRITAGVVVTTPMVSAALGTGGGAGRRRALGPAEDAVLHRWTAVRQAFLVRVPADPAHPAGSPADRAVLQDRIVLLDDEHLVVADFSTPDVALAEAWRPAFADIAATVEVSP